MPRFLRSLHDLTDEAFDLAAVAGADAAWSEAEVVVTAGHHEVLQAPGPGAGSRIVEIISVSSDSDGRVISSAALKTQ